VKEAVAVPAGVVTVIVNAPSAASDGTVVAIDVAVFEPMVADALPKVTAVASAKLVPEIVTAAPGAPDVGETAVIVGLGLASFSSSSLQAITITDNSAKSIR